MRVRFREPQPGTFYVGSPHGSFTFQNGYNNDIPQAVFDEWLRVGLAVERIDPPTKTPEADVETPLDLETVAPPAKKTAAPKARTTRATTKRTGTRKATARA